MGGWWLSLKRLAHVFQTGCTFGRPAPVSPSPRPSPTRGEGETPSPGPLPPPWGRASTTVDETGFLKKGTRSAGVARQYSGTAGRVENSQVGVFVAYASCFGQTLLDRALYLPASWTKDPERCQRAGIAPEVGFATKPELAQAMLERAFAAGVPASWVVGDSAYGDARRLRRWLETQERAYVLAVSSKEHVWLGGMQRSVKSVLEGLDEDAWQRLSAGSGSKGPRLYDWQCVRLMAPCAVDWCRYLLVRRSLQADRKLTAYLVFAPSRTELATLVSVAGRRWCIEMCFEAAKGEVGLDEYEVRSWTGWYVQPWLWEAGVRENVAISACKK